MEKRLKVLLVEDDRFEQLNTARILKSFSCDVDLAISGREGFELSLERAYNLILMDLGLSDDNGFNVVQQIKAQSPLNRTTPIIALTAHSDDLYRKQALAVGMDDFLSKPLQNKTLEKLIDRLRVD